MTGAEAEDAGTAPRGGHRPDVSAVRRKPSITDVARIAGVSYQTVSRVITGSPSVSPATRARVREVIAEVGYRRNKAATALVTNRSTTIGIMTDDSPRYGPVATLLALESAARRGRLRLRGGRGERAVRPDRPRGDGLAGRRRGGRHHRDRPGADDGDRGAQGARRMSRWR